MAYNPYWFKSSDATVLTGRLRYGVIADTASSGVVQSYAPSDVGTGVAFGEETTGIRVSPPAALIIRGMPLAAGQEIALRVGRTATFPVVLMNEDTGAASAAERFSNPNNANLILRRGEGVIIRNTESRNTVQASGEDQVKLMSKLTGIGSATNATTELSGSGVITFPPDFLLAGMVFEFKSFFEFIHTAAATPLIDFGFAVSGSASYASITPAANAGTFYGEVDGVARVSSIGAGGAWRTNLVWRCPFGATLPDQIGGAVGLPAVNTTISNTLELRLRMNTAVAANTLGVYNGYGSMLG